MAGALKNFELENDGRPSSAPAGTAVDDKDPKYFKHLRIFSPLALVKMVKHARSGGSLEVMALIQGKIDPATTRGCLRSS